MNFLFILLVIIFFNLIECEDKCPADWDPYDDQRKCLKIVDDSLQTYTNSMATCAKLAPNATLLTIHSSGEQDFLNRYLYVDNKLVDTIWLGGVVQGNNIMTWLDNSPVSYTNWFEGRPRQQQSTINCVEQQSEPTIQGKWYDIYCTKRNQVVCHLMMQSSIPVIDLEKLILETRKYVQDQIKILKNENARQQVELDNLVANPVPIGFIYVQLSGQPEPSQLWSQSPTIKWLEVTSDYSGLFFRAEGSDSAPFGQIQASNSSRLAAIKTQSCMGTVSDCEYTVYSIPESGWSVGLVKNFINNGLYVYMTSGENRPRNQAIRIYKRIA
ncbi:uncharacterized protein LOC128953287 [Oppia nitens]|uniref:uncharacterized protein LOC128953287 n=1 Tax=Oppia nitens TaxID=1686743 RepID=UPI0023DA9E6F|nr:uncharacterized protein LOC128953287 [Oppia nitens]